VMSRARNLLATRREVQDAYQRLYYPTTIDSSLLFTNPDASGTGGNSSNNTLPTNESTTSLGRRQMRIQLPRWVYLSTKEEIKERLISDLRRDIQATAPGDELAYAQKALEYVEKSTTSTSTTTTEEGGGEEAQEGDQCPICYQDYSHVEKVKEDQDQDTTEEKKEEDHRFVRTYCGHHFCYQCMKSYITASNHGERGGRMLCPQCRGEVSGKGKTAYILNVSKSSNNPKKGIAKPGGSGQQGTELQPAEQQPSSSVQYGCKLRVIIDHLKVSFQRQPPLYTNAKTLLFVQTLDEEPEGNHLLTDLGCTLRNAGLAAFRHSQDFNDTTHLCMQIASVVIIDPSTVKSMKRDRHHWDKYDFREILLYESGKDGHEATDTMVKLKQQDYLDDILLVIRKRKKEGGGGGGDGVESSSSRDAVPDIPSITITTFEPRAIPSPRMATRPILTAPTNTRRARSTPTTRGGGSHPSSSSTSILRFPRPGRPGITISGNVYGITMSSHLSMTSTNTNTSTTSATGRVSQRRVIISPSPSPSPSPEPSAPIPPPTSSSSSSAIISTVSGMVSGVAGPFTSSSSSSPSSSSSTYTVPATILSSAPFNISRHSLLSYEPAPFTPSEPPRSTPRSTDE